MIVSVYDDRRCFLGEGVLWHPLRQQLLWSAMAACCRAMYKVRRNRTLP